MIHLRGVLSPQKMTLVLVVGMARKKGTLLKCEEMAVLCYCWGSLGIGGLVRARVWWRVVCRDIGRWWHPRKGQNSCATPTPTGCMNLDKTSFHCLWPRVQSLKWVSQWAISKVSFSFYQPPSSGAWHISLDERSCTSGLPHVPRVLISAIPSIVGRKTVLYGMRFEMHSCPKKSPYFPIKVPEMPTFASDLRGRPGNIVERAWALVVRHNC